MLHFPRSETMKYTRCLSDIPVDVRRETAALCSGQGLRNISYGGLCFTSVAMLKKDALLSVSIMAVHPAFRSRARVAWCAPSGKRYVVGLEFLDANNEARAVLMEQVLDIEGYRNGVFRKTGIRLTGEQAADEWRRQHEEYFNFTE